MRSYAKANSHQAHADTQRPETARQPPEIERRRNAGWLKLWRAVYPNTPPPADKGRRPKAEDRSSLDRRPAAVERLASFLAAWLVLALLVTGCASRPLRGGKAVTTRKPAGIIEQTLMQGENPAQPTKQTQETVKVRTYTVPAGSRMEQSQSPAAAPAQRSTLNTQPITLPPSTLNLSTRTPQLSTLNPQPRSSSARRCP